MKEPDEIVVLNPNEWRSEREKPREPIFGPGLPGALAYVVGFTLTVAVSYWLRH